MYRALMYRRGDVASFVPLPDDEIIGTPTLFTENAKKERAIVSRRIPQ